MNCIASLFFPYDLAKQNRTLNLNQDDANTMPARGKSMPSRGKIISLVQGNFPLPSSFLFSEHIVVQYDNFAHAKCVNLIDNSQANVHRRTYKC